MNDGKPEKGKMNKLIREFNKFYGIDSTDGVKMLNRDLSAFMTWLYTDKKCVIIPMSVALEYGIP